MNENLVFFFKHGRLSSSTQVAPIRGGGATKMVRPAVGMTQPAARAYRRGRPLNSTSLYSLECKRHAFLKKNEVVCTWCYTHGVKTHVVKTSVARGVSSRVKKAAAAAAAAAQLWGSQWNGTSLRVGCSRLAPASCCSRSAAGGVKSWSSSSACDFFFVFGGGGGGGGGLWERDREREREEGI